MGLDLNKEKFKITGITGTNGKTTVAHLVMDLLSQCQVKTGFIGTLGVGLMNNLVPNNYTTPDNESLKKYFKEFSDNNVKTVAMEVSSHGLVQNRVKGLCFENVVFTNFSQDHLDYHENLDNYYKAKEKLFTEYTSENQIINLDCKRSYELITNLNKSNNKKLNIYGYSLNKNINSILDNKNIKYVFTENYEIGINKVCAKINTPWGVLNIESPLIGEFNLQNLLVAITVCCLQKIDLKTIEQACENVSPIPGRMNCVSEQPKIIIDFAHTEDALRNTLIVLNQIKGQANIKNSKIYCVFGCGGDRDKDKRPKMLATACKYSDQVIITTDNPRSEDPEKIVEDMLHNIKDNKIIIELDRAEAINLAIQLANEQDIVIIAGKGHEKYQIIKGEKKYFSDHNQALQALMLKNKDDSYVQ